MTPVWNLARQRGQSRYWMTMLLTMLF